MSKIETIGYKKGDANLTIIQECTPTTILTYKDTTIF